MVGRCPPGGCSDRVASGGAVTALLRWALESGFADGVVGVGMDPARPTRTQTHLAGSLEELNLLSGSCYQIASHGAVIPRLKNLGRRLIYVGLPCHIHALRKAQQLGLADNVVLAVGIFCGFNLLPEATDFLIRKLRRGKEEARRVEFRGGPWPGGFRVAWNSGRESFIAKDAYSLCDALFLPEFCNYCPDLAAELADVSFADAWYRPGGWSTVLTRSKMGRYCVHEASRLGFLLTGPALTEEVVVTQAHTIAHKKRGIAARLAGLPPAQRPVFSGFGLDTTPEGTWGAWYRWAPTLARQGFQLLPLACFKAASRISRRLVVHL
jgi:coenzyme F420-reducing hydrogenase beta subunit